MYRRGKWEQVDADKVSRPLLDLTYRLRDAKSEQGMRSLRFEEKYMYVPNQQLLIYEGDDWRWTKAQNIVALQLDSTNHAPALFENLAALCRAKHAYNIEIKEKHAFIFGKAPSSLALFS